MVPVSFLATWQVAVPFNQERVMVGGEGLQDGNSGAPGRSGKPSRQSRLIDPTVAIRRGEGAQMKWCRDPRCSP